MNRIDRPPPKRNGHGPRPPRGRRSPDGTPTLASEPHRRGSKTGDDRDDGHGGTDRGNVVQSNRKAEPEDPPPRTQSPNAPGSATSPGSDTAGPRTCDIKRRTRPTRQAAIHQSSGKARATDQNTPRHSGDEPQQQRVARPGERVPVVGNHDITHEALKDAGFTTEYIAALYSADPPPALTHRPPTAVPAEAINVYSHHHNGPEPTIRHINRTVDKGRSTPIAMSNITTMARQRLDQGAKP